MAPIPPMLIRAATIFLTTALTRRLQQSPLFFRVVDRLIHEIDHLPHRINGKPVEYRRIDPQEPTLSEQAQDAWNHRLDDPGEPHDLPNPFASSKPQQSIPDVSETSSSSTSTIPPDRIKRDGIRRAAQNRTQQSNRRGKTQQTKTGDAKMDEMRSMLERLRETRQQEQDRPS